MSDNQSVRAYIKTALAPFIAERSWTFIEHQRIPETIAVTTVVLKHSGMERLAQAPMGTLRNTVTLTIVDPHSDQVKAEDDLDQSVLELCSAIDGLSRINWTGAKKVSVTDTNIGWDITLTVLSGKEA